MSSRINMNYGYLKSDNSFGLNHNIRSSDGIVIDKIKPVSNSDGIQINDYNEKESKNNDDSSENSHLLTTDRIIELAVNKDMNTDKTLIGSECSLESLDVKKAISDMQRDKILKEYQIFVVNPEIEDGYMKKL